MGRTVERFSHLSERIAEITMSGRKSTDRASFEEYRSRSESGRATTWSKEDALVAGPGLEHVVILPTVGCSHCVPPSPGCTMCGFFGDTPLVDPRERHPDGYVDVLTNIFDIAFKRAFSEDGSASKRPAAFKIFTSGSFFDPVEVPDSLRSHIYGRLAKAVSDGLISEVVVESRPEYVTPATASGFREGIPHALLEVGIGLESADDTVREVFVRKSFTKEDFLTATKVLAEAGVGTKAYLMLKPPMLTESDAVKDVIESVRWLTSDVVPSVTSISINPCTVQRGTLVAHMERDGKYRPPWLWSVVDVLVKSDAIRKSETSRKARWGDFGGIYVEKETPVRLLCDVVSAGKARGAHNCGKCDPEVASSIKKAHLSGDYQGLGDIEGCTCRDVWSRLKHLPDSFSTT